MRTKASRKGSSIFQSGGVLSTLILVICIAVISVLLSLRIQQLTREQCFSLLSSSTREVCTNVENNFRSDRTSLRMLSRVIALEDVLDPDAVTHLLTSYDVSSMIPNIAVLTPDGRIMPVRGGVLSAEGIMDYAALSRMGEHMSGLHPSLSNADTKVLRSFVPIKKNGKVAGILFIEMDPAAIAAAWSPDIYDDSASFCIVDRSSGGFLVNSWDTSVQNVSDLNDTALAEALCGGETGFSHMQDAAGETIYLSYMPMEMEDWQIIITAKESDVFSFVDQMRRSLRLFLMTGGLVLVLYLLWLMYNNRRSIQATEEQANIDVLTGLQNRNLYEAYCKRLEKRYDIACIYLDANGLHELNNTRGHLAGDQMLRFIADTLKVAFGESSVYRIGGDEFVVLQKGKTADGLAKTMQEVNTELERNNYHVSSGICVREKDMTVPDMIKTAEKRMYEAKQRYYESIGQPVRNQNE